jgi:hypothetical protein
VRDRGKIVGGNEQGGTAMRKVIVSEFLSLDGVMQAPGNTE